MGTFLGCALKTRNKSQNISTKVAISCGVCRNARISLFLCLLKGLKGECPVVYFFDQIIMATKHVKGMLVSWRTSEDFITFGIDAGLAVRALFILCDVWWDSSLAKCVLFVVNRFQHVSFGGIFKLFIDSIIFHLLPLFTFRYCEIETMCRTIIYASGCGVGGREIWCNVVLPQHKDNSCSWMGLSMIYT